MTPPEPGIREFPVFDRALLDYLPPVIQDAAEMEQIMAAEQPELFELWKAAQRVLDEQFIETMSSYGVRRWERILQITSRAADTLEERKERIYTFLRSRLPYTLRWLQQYLLESFGEGNYRLNIDRYTIEITLFVRRWPEGHPIHSVHLDVLDMLDWVKPAEMIMKIIRALEFSRKLYLNTAACATADLTLPPVGARRQSKRAVYFHTAAYIQTETTLRPAA